MGCVVCRVCSVCVLCVFLSVFCVCYVCVMCYVCSVCVLCVCAPNITLQQANFITHKNIPIVKNNISHYYTNMSIKPKLLRCKSTFSPIVFFMM